ncbi:hypothetical protein QFZ24_009970 [Streptomyces phaeochromogenes]|nr:hypothetical protein [Streptomyces phaeochromogenes]
MISQPRSTSTSLRPGRTFGEAEDCFRTGAPRCSLHQTGFLQPILDIFDSWGSVNVPLDVMRRIARNPSSEVVTTFGPNWFSRRENLNPDVLDAVFGCRLPGAEPPGDRAP